MTTFGHFLIIVLWVAGVLGLMCGLMWVRWQVDKKRPDSYWRRQPP